MNCVSLLKGILKATIVVSKLDYHVIFTIATHNLINKTVMYRNIVLSIVIITIMKITFNIGKFSKLFRIMKLLGKSTVFPARVSLDKFMIIYILVNG